MTRRYPLIVVTVLCNLFECLTEAGAKRNLLGGIFWQNSEGGNGKEVQSFVFWVISCSKFLDETSFKYDSSPSRYEKFVILSNLPKPVFHL